MKSFVVSGASTGVTRGCVKVLAASDCLVFAGVRRCENAEWLKKEFGERVPPLIFDVADHAAVAVAAAIADLGECHPVASGRPRLAPIRLMSGWG